MTKSSNPTTLKPQKVTSQNTDITRFKDFENEVNNRRNQSRTEKMYEMSYAFIGNVVSVLDESEKENKELKIENEKLIKENENQRIEIEYLKSMLRELGVEPPMFISGAPFVSPEKKRGRKIAKKYTFRELMQGDDIDEKLEKLHKLIDGKGGKAVAMVLEDAWKKKILTRLPNENEFMTEFKLCTTWRAVSLYLPKPKRTNDKYKINL